MCTASWWFAPDGSYEVFFNRDERKDRVTGVAPRALRRDGVAFLAPLDGARGGSWFASNELGVTICLLNHYPTRETPLVSADDAHTRGELVLRCAPAADVDGVLDLLERQELGLFRPFHLLALDLNGQSKLMTWDGRALEHTVGGVEGPITSSSYQTDAVVEERRRAFSHLTGSAPPGGRPPLEIFHDQHDPSRGAHSVLMNRPDACTVSQLRARVSEGELRLTYRAANWAQTRSRWPVSESALPVRSLLALAS